MWKKFQWTYVDVGFQMFFVQLIFLDILHDWQHFVQKIFIDVLLLDRVLFPFNKVLFPFFYTDKEIHRLQGLYLFWYILRLTAICSDKLIISEAGNYNSSFRANIIKNIQLGQLGHLEGGKCAWMWRFDFCCFCCCLMFSKFFFIVLIYPSIMRVCSEQHFLRVYLKFRSPPGPNF